MKISVAVHEIFHIFIHIYIYLYNYVQTYLHITQRSLSNQLYSCIYSAAKTSLFICISYYTHILPHTHTHTPIQPHENFLVIVFLCFPRSFSCQSKCYEQLVIYMHKLTKAIYLNRKKALKKRQSYNITKSRRYYYYYNYV